MEILKYSEDIDLSGYVTLSRTTDTYRYSDYTYLRSLQKPLLHTQL